MIRRLGIAHGGFAKAAVMEDLLHEHIKRLERQWKLKQLHAAKAKAAHGEKDYDRGNS